MLTPRMPACLANAAFIPKDSGSSYVTICSVAPERRNGYAHQPNTSKSKSPRTRPRTARLTVLEHASHSRSNPPAPTKKGDAPGEFLTNAPCVIRLMNWTWPESALPPALVTTTFTAASVIALADVALSGAAGSASERRRRERSPVAVDFETYPYAGRPSMICAAGKPAAVQLATAAWAFASGCVELPQALLNGALGPGFGDAIGTCQPQPQSVKCDDSQFQTS